MHSVLITGANCGLGLELVVQFLDHPTVKPERVIAAVKNPKQSKELLALAQKDKRLRVLELDVTKYESFTGFVWKVSEIVGDKGLNLLINNAEIQNSSNKPLLEVTAELFQMHFDTNTIAPILLTKAFLPLLKKAAIDNKSKGLGVNRAAVVFMSSILGSVGAHVDFGTFWGYRESKAALNMAARTINKELNSDGIAVLTVHPGRVWTDSGDPDTLFPTTDSIQDLMKVILALNENTTGGFIQYDRKYISW